MMFCQIENINKDTEMVETSQTETLELKSITEMKKCTTESHQFQQEWRIC